MGALLSGEMEVVHDDGSKARLSAGSAYIIEPGHDAWVVGDEPAVGLEFESTQRKPTPRRSAAEQASRAGGRGAVEVWRLVGE